MSNRFDRFGKLENERERPAQENLRPSLERFGAEAPARGQPAEADAPGGAPLARFEADGGEHVRLEEDPLAGLGIRRCAACEKDNGKFDTRCIFCGASLTSPEAMALNLSLLEQQQQAQAASAARSREANVREILEVADERLRRERKEETELSFSHPKGVRNTAMVVGAIACFAVALAAHSFCLSFPLLFAGVVLLGLRAPRLLAVLGTRLGRRGWW